MDPDVSERRYKLGIGCKPLIFLLIAAYKAVRPVEVGSVLPSARLAYLTWMCIAACYRCSWVVGCQSFVSVSLWTRPEA